MALKSDIPAAAEKTSGWRGSRKVWLDAAKHALIGLGVDAVKIQPQANRMNISRTSFSWFFKVRSVLLDALLGEREARNPCAVIEARGACAETVSEGLFEPQHDYAIRGRADQSAALAARINEADAVRLAAIRALFDRLGFESNEADVGAPDRRPDPDRLYRDAGERERRRADGARSGLREDLLRATPFTHRTGPVSRAPEIRSRPHKPESQHPETHK